MFTLFRFFISTLLLLTLQASGRNFNLPDRFDVKVIKQWSFYNGKLMTDKDTQRENSRELIFHFNRGKFILNDPKHKYIYTDNMQVYGYIESEASGTLRDGKLIGVEEYKYLGYFQGKLNHNNKGTLKLSGTIDNSGQIDIVTSNLVHTYCKNLYTDSKSWKNCPNNQNGTFEHHYLLQLPINQSQSSQIPIIEKPQEESEENSYIDNIQESTDKEANNIEVEQEVKKTYSNPCRDPELKNQKEWREYCANKAYNKKLDIQQEQDELEEEKAQKKADEEYEKKLKKWEEETKVENARLAKEFKKQRDSWRKRDKKYDEQKKIKIAKKLKEKKEFQEQQQLNLKFINKFTPASEWDSAYKRIKKLDKLKDSKKSKKIYEAHKKIYYDSKQIKEQANAEYQNAKADEIDKKGKYVKSIKDTSLTANKIIAKFDPTGTGDKIVNTMEHTYSAIEGAEKNGISGAIVKVMDIHTNSVATDIVDTAEDYHQLHTKGIKLNKDEKYYDKDGNRVKKIKSGDKTYATKEGNKGEAKEFSLMDRVEKKVIKKVDETYNPQTKVDNAIKKISDGIKEGNLNKVANGTIDVVDIKDELDRN